LLKFLSGRSLRLLVLLLVSMLILNSCGTSPLSLLTGGGPNVAANTQVGKTNSQTVGTTTNNSNSNVDKVDQSSNDLKAETVDTVNIQQTPIWMIVLLILGWLLPSPNEIARWFKGLFKRDAKKL